MVRPSSQRMHHLLACGGLLLALTAFDARDAGAQSIGLEAGASSVEGLGGARPTLGLTIFLPLTERLRLGVTGTQWTGCPVADCDDPYSGPGNRGLNVVGLFDVLGGGRAGVSLGAGMGWYETKEAAGGGADTDTSYEEAFTFAAELRRAVAYNSGLYLRGETSFPTDGGDARWSSLRLGADVRIF